MIGLDRPIKPEWVYKTLQMIEEGHKPNEYNVPFEDIAQELVGKEGKRKARTVIFRSFVYTHQESRSVIKHNEFIEMANNESVERLQPIFLMKFLMDYEICILILKKVSQQLSHERKFSTELLRKQVVQSYGDRDVVVRSYRAFIKTLQYFGLIENDSQYFQLKGPLSLDDYQMKTFIKLYGKVHLKSEVINLEEIDPAFSLVFDLSNMYEVARNHHQQAWEYIREHGRNMIILK